ncbi:MAG: AmmeMemoRadiSam system protein B [Gammaproteobacteria bacterium]|nr:AmmeMemoRadiSam system protein B [Gammaproteobacteria bacterium]
MLIREPAVAGMFYPADAAVLRRDIKKLLGNGEISAEEPPKAMIVPHAGYIYSGAVAAKAYRCLRPIHDRIRRVVMLGPAHRVWLDGLALPAADAFSTPLGDVPIDAEVRDQIRDMDGVSVSEDAHYQEHCLEVQLPFLQVVLDDFELVPMVVGNCSAEVVAAVIDQVWDGPETLVIISSDLSHYHSYVAAEQIDARTSHRICDKATDLLGEEACGAAAINGLMACAHCRDLSVEEVDLRNSGDTSGDARRVVGYGAYVLH